MSDLNFDISGTNNSSSASFPFETIDNPKESKDNKSVPYLPVTANETKQESQTLTIEEIITKITNLCSKGETAKLKELCANLLSNEKNKMVESVIGNGILNYIQQSNTVVKDILVDMKTTKQASMIKIYKMLIRGAIQMNNLSFMNYVVGLQKDLDIHINDILEACCASTNAEVVNDIIELMYKNNQMDVTSGMKGACFVKNDMMVTYLLDLVEEKKMTIKYDECLSVALETASTGIMVMLLDKMKGTKPNMKPIMEKVKQINNNILTNFITKKCKERGIEL